MENISIIYEDKNIVAVNKPSGLLVHATENNNKEKTLVDWILKKYPQIKGVGEDSTRPGIVHRTDKETSGILLIAKNQKTFLFLKKNFQEHLIKKVYRAIVYGSVKKDEGEINFSIGRSKKDFRLKSADKKARGQKREALTFYKVLARNDHFSYIEVLPQTGRTHQIRVHLKAINYSVVCDSLYAPARECPEELGRLGLHALSLEFKTQDGIQRLLEAPLPLDIKKILSTLFPKLPRG